jgi:hypothetical protein
LNFFGKADLSILAKPELECIFHEKFLNNIIYFIFLLRIYYNCEINCETKAYIIILYTYNLRVLIYVKICHIYLYYGLHVFEVFDK